MTSLKLVSSQIVLVIISKILITVQWKTGNMKEIVNKNVDIESKTNKRKIYKWF